MTYWITTRIKFETIVKIVILTLAVVFLSISTVMPVWASDMPNNIVVYDNKEKTLKITEISFTNDFSSMSVLVENIQTKADFRVEHELDTGDTFNEYIEITATDGMGNMSETVHIKNPFYMPVVIEEPPIVGSLNVTGGNGSGNTNESENVNIIETENKDESDFVNDEPAQQNNGFKTNGWASVADNATTNSKEFYIVKSETGNEFYMIIDRENGKDNVYFLNAVTEWDLLGLTAKYEVPNNLAPNDPLNNMGNTATANNTAEPQNNNTGENTQPTPSPTEVTEKPSESPQQGGIGIFGIAALLVFVGAIGAYFYFFKIKKKPAQSTNADDYLPDDYGDEDGEDDNANDADSDDEDGEEYEDDEGEMASVRLETEKTPNPDTEPNRESTPKTTSETATAANKTAVSDNPDNDDGDEIDFTDDDVGDDDYNEQAGYDDYTGEIDESDVLGGAEGGEDEYEDRTV